MNDQTQQAPKYYGFDDSMFEGTKIDFHTFKNGEHRFRILPPFAPGRLFHKLGIHWGYRDQSGGAKAITCLLEEHDTCPICDVVNQQREVHKQKKARIDELNAMMATASPDQHGSIQAEMGRLKQEMEDVYSYISEHKRKPTYLWNIMTEEGTQKVLKLSYNGHEPLYNKVKFFWKERKINVSDPTANYLLWVSRTGQKAQTRYTYEVLDNTQRQINFSDLTDLSRVYRLQSIADLRQVVEQGYVATTGSTPDPTEQNYSAQPPVSGNNGPTNHQAGAQPNQTPGGTPAAQPGAYQPASNQPSSAPQNANPANGAQPTNEQRPMSHSPQPDVGANGNGQPVNTPAPESQNRALTPDPQPTHTPANNPVNNAGAGTSAPPVNNAPINNQAQQAPAENIQTTPAQDQNIQSMMNALQGGQ